MPRNSVSTTSQADKATHSLSISMLLTTLKGNVSSMPCAALLRLLLITDSIHCLTLKTAILFGERTICISVPFHHFLSRTRMGYLWPSGCCSTTAHIFSDYWQCWWWLMGLGVQHNLEDYRFPRKWAINRIFSSLSAWNSTWVQNKK